MNDHEAAPRISGPFAHIGAVVGGILGGVISGVAGHYFGEAIDDGINHHGVDRIAERMG